MKVNNLFNKTEKLPEVLFRTDDSCLEIKGRLLTDNYITFTTELHSWIEVYLITNSRLKVVFFIEYLRAGAIHQFIEILLTIKQNIHNGKDIEIVWKYEEEDESMLELGEFLIDLTGVQIVLEIAKTE
jgi:hypothetical protein